MGRSAWHSLFSSAHSRRSIPPEAGSRPLRAGSQALITGDVPFRRDLTAHLISDRDQATSCAAFRFA